MSINRIFIALAALLLTLSPNARAAAQSKLGAAKSIRCTFPTIATGSWKDGKPEAAVKPASLVLEFESINTDEGSAQLKGGYGTYDIIVRLAGTYLHFHPGIPRWTSLHDDRFRDGKHEGKVKGRALPGTSITLRRCRDLPQVRSSTMGNARL